MTPSRIAVLRISMTNATMLSVVYLVLATFIELGRRFTGAQWLENLTKLIESFPVGVLRTIGLYTPLQRAWVENDLTNTQVRLLYGASVVVMIYLLSMVVSLGMWAVMWFQDRRARRAD